MHLLLKSSMFPIKEGNKDLFSGLDHFQLKANKM